MLNLDSENERIVIFDALVQPGAEYEMEYWDTYTQKSWKLCIAYIVKFAPGVPRSTTNSKCRCSAWGMCSTELYRVIV